MKVDPQGQAATTRWRVIGRFSGRGGSAGGAVTALALEPLTGRTHQLRVHMAAMGWPILGDTVYGDAPRSGGPMLHLHARAISLPLYPGREPVRAEAPLPAHMRTAMADCGVGEEGSAMGAPEDAPGRGLQGLRAMKMPPPR